MTDFFKHAISRMVIINGVDMVSMLTAEELDELVSELVSLGNAYPFKHIPEATKKKIVNDNIQHDDSIVTVPFGQKPGLNRKVLERWYSRWIDRYGLPELVNPNQDEKEQHAPAPPEVADKYLNQIKGMLISGMQKPTFGNIQAEMQNIQVEDDQRVGRAVSTGHRIDHEYAARAERKRKACQARGIDKLGLHELKRFDIEGEIIFCRNVDEARAIFLEL